MIDIMIDNIFHRAENSSRLPMRFSIVRALQATHELVNQGKTITFKKMIFFVG